MRPEYSLLTNNSFSIVLAQCRSRDATEIWNARHTAKHILRAARTFTLHACHIIHAVSLVIKNIFGFLKVNFTDHYTSHRADHVKLYLTPNLRLTY